MEFTLGNTGSTIKASFMKILLQDLAHIRAQFYIQPSSFCMPLDVPAFGGGVFDFWLTTMNKNKKVMESANKWNAKFPAA